MNRSSHHNDAVERKRGKGGGKNTVMMVLLVVAVCLVTMSLLPVLLLETSPIHNTRIELGPNNGVPASPVIEAQSASSSSSQVAPYKKTRVTKDGRTIADISLTELTPDVGFTEKPIARGVAGRPLSATPTVKSAKRAHIECDIDVDSLAYWNEDPYDEKSPFAVTDKEKFITFTPDRGGWNNVRMSLEILFVIAAATGRTLVLPPREPLYLMHHDKSNKYRGFADFFPLDKLKHRVKVISMNDYLANPLSPPIPSNLNEENVRKAADHCDHRAKSSNACNHAFDYIRATGTFVNISASHTCLIFDEEAYRTGDPPSSPDVLNHIHEECGTKRDTVYWDQATLAEPEVLHFEAGAKQTRLLTHFYGMIHFTDARLDNVHRRFIRDYLHYHDVIYCAAGKIIKAVQAEAVTRQMGLAATVDDEGAGAFSSMHIRRGDLQYKRVKIPAQEWYDNTKEVWHTNELLYIATDERDKSFFDDLAKHHELRFLDDYWDLAGLKDLDPNYMGMIDTIVASRARAFAGTWFSTFSGYISRLRGYHGMTMHDTWYSFLPKKTAMHEWDVVADFVYAYEYPDGWIGIDADVWPQRDKF